MSAIPVCTTDISILCKDTGITKGIIASTSDEKLFTNGSWQCADEAAVDYLLDWMMPGSFDGIFEPAVVKGPNGLPPRGNM